MNTTNDISAKEYYKGQNFSGQKLSFKVDECVGINAGGNGEVYKVKAVGLAGEHVVKFLKHKFLESGKKDDLARKQRFIAECQRTKIINSKLNNKHVIPIIDSCNMENTDNAKVLWYIMPEAEMLFKYLCGQDMVTKIEYMIKIGESIVAMHNLGYQHRDIKPENILLYKGEIYLGDLGLVFDENDLKNNVAVLDEAIGPTYYRPPELDKFVKNKISLDMKAVDVYEFAKTVWAFLTENKGSFQGQYDKTKYPRVALSKETVQKFDEIKILTLEDLNTFLTKATDNIPSRRPTIEECITMLRNWLGNYNNAEVARQQIIQSLVQEIPKSYLPGQMIYFNENSNVNELVTIITNCGNCLSINLPKLANCQVVSASASLMEGYMQLKLSFRKQIFNVMLKVDKIIINNDNGDRTTKTCVIQTKDVYDDNNNFDSFIDMSTLNILPGSFIIDTSKEYIIKDRAILEFVPKSIQELFAGN